MRFLLRIVDKAPVPPEEQERLALYGIFLLLALLVIGSFCLLNLMAGQLLLASLAFLVLAGLLFGWILMCHLPCGMWVYRINAAMFSGLLLYLFAIGGEHGSKCLWLLPFPMIVFFLLGKREGAAWTILLFLAAVALVSLPTPLLQLYPYTPDVLLRLVSVYAVLSLIAFGFEYFRQYYREGMLAESTRLQEVLDALPEAICLINDRGVAILCNQAFLAQTGRRAEQVVGCLESEVLADPTTAVDALLRLPLPGSGANSPFTVLVQRPKTIPPSQPAVAFPPVIEALSSLYAPTKATLLGPGQLPASPMVPGSLGQVPPFGQPAADLRAKPRDPFPSPTPQVEPKVKMRQGVTAMLVDDDPMVREISSLMLTNLGFKVLVAADGVEAVELFRAHPKQVDVVLCDQFMPRLDGWGTLSTLYAIDPSVPVIIISGYDAQPPPQDMPPHQYLTKPYTMDVLREAIHEALGQTEAAS